MPADPLPTPQTEATVETSGAAPNTTDRASVDDVPRSLSQVLGIVYCLLAAVGYTLANIALRRVSDLDPFVVSAVKAVPTMAVMAPAVIAMWMRGTQLVPRSGTLKPLIFGCLVGQLVGNCSFQYSLGIVGLALAVPICLAAMVIGGAISGRMVLGERVSPRTIVSIVILLIATIILSLGSGGSAVREGLTTMQIAGGVISVAASGFAYALFGTMIRRSLLNGMAVSTTMFVSGAIGTIGLFVVALGVAGVEGLTQCNAAQWMSMLAAGICNLGAFFLLTVALKVVSVVVVNLVNGTQVAMAALAGVIVFNEPVTSTMIVGVALTAVGLIVVGKRK